jgi:hypothetical protein
LFLCASCSFFPPAIYPISNFVGGGQEFVSVSSHELVESRLYCRRRIKGKNNQAISADPFFHSVYDELLFGYP